MHFVCKVNSMRLSTMDEIEALAAKLKAQGQCEAWLSEAHPSLKIVSSFPMRWLRHVCVTRTDFEHSKRTTHGASVGTHSIP